MQYIGSQHPFRGTANSLQTPTNSAGTANRLKNFERHIRAPRAYGNRITHGKNGFVTATTLGTTNTFFVAATKTFAAATKSFVDRTKYSVVEKKYFCYPYFNI